MDIKQILKEMDIKLGTFAEKLEISRPTLNSYIVAYENNEELQSDKHQKIFDALFSKEKSKEEFGNILNNYQRLLDRDKILGTLEFDMGKTDLITSIIEKMKKDLSDKDYDEDIYRFINMIISSYREVLGYKELAKYFVVLNGIRDLEELTDNEKVFVSNCYKLMSLNRNKELKLDADYFDKFKTRVFEVKKINNTKANQKADDIKKLLEETIKSKLQEQINLGVDIDNVDIDKIVKELVNVQINEQ